MKLYALSIPDVLEEHEYSDTVAICQASSKTEAIKKFRQLYDYNDDVMNRYVTPVFFNKYEIAILTSY